MRGARPNLIGPQGQENHPEPPNTLRESQFLTMEPLANPVPTRMHPEDALEPTVFLIDDQEIELELMQRWCRKAGLKSQIFHDPAVLLESLDMQSTGCVVADLWMPLMSGLELQSEIARRGWIIPVILVTGQGDAENCRAAFQQGVFDFIEKGFDSLHFIESVQQAIDSNRHERHRHRERRDARELLESTSKREKEVVLLLADGMTLKSIAHELDISVQTASKHRSSIFKKLSIDSEVELYKLLLTAEINLPPSPFACGPGERSTTQVDTSD